MTSVNVLLRQALTDQVIKYESNNKQYECLVCHIRMTGEASATDHVKSRPHRVEGSRKAIKNLLTSKKNPPSLQQLLPSIVKVAVNEGMVSLTGSKDYKCNRCNLLLKGIIDLENHLRSSNHIKAKGGHQPLPATSRPQVLSPPRNSTLQVSQPLKSITIPGEIKRELADGTVIETDSKTDPFRCTVCDKYFNSSNTLSDHLRSKKHKDKKIGNRVQPPSSGYMGGATSLPVGFADERYAVESNPRGHVYVFNYLFKGTQKERVGAELDSKNLENTFTKMGYCVFLFSDLTKDETYRELERIQRKPELQKIDAFIMCLLSHGENPDTFYSSDMKYMSLQYIRGMFMDGECPHLRRKPRIFFANYCRGKDLQKKERLECDSVVEAPNNMAIIHAATEGIKAFRSRSSGTIFISCLCEVLREHARDRDLHSIYLKLADKMVEKEGTRPMWVNYCFKHFYFNPVPY